MLWSSLFWTLHPGGSVRISPLFATVLPEVVAGVGVATGLGVPAGLGLGRMPEVPWLEVVLLLSTAIAVPAPAMTRTRTTIAAMMSIQGVRCTGGCGPTALGW